MCLLVHDVPNALHPLITSCWKRLHMTQDGSIKTPVMRSLIPDDGWLFPTRRLSLKRLDIFDGSELGAGVIHAYCRIPRRFKNKDKYGPYIHCKAYAFHVVAYQSESLFVHRREFVALACRALYIPELDKTDNQKQILALIRKFRGRTELTKSELDSLHVRLYRKLG